MLGRKSKYSKIGTVVAVVGTGAILYYAIAAFLFCDAYPNRPTSPLPVAPNADSGLATPSLLVPGSAATTIPPSGVGEGPEIAGVGMDDMEKFSLLRLRRIEDAWLRFSGGDLPVTDTEWGDLADEYAEEKTSEPAAQFRWANAQESADRSFEGLAALFSGTLSPKSAAWLAEADYPGRSRSGILMDEPFEQRMVKFPYTPMTDDFGVGELPDMFSGLDARGAQLSNIWSAPALSGARYRMYGDETGGYGSPFLDTFDTSDSGRPTFGMGGYPLSTEPALQSIEDPWRIDTPLFEEPR